MKLAALSGLVILTLAATLVSAQRGDLDGDGDVDRDDLNLLLLRRNTAANGPGDPGDLDGDGMITALDARILMVLITEAQAPRPIKVEPIPDESARVSAELTVDGVSLVAMGEDGTRFTLTIPPGAVREPRTISMTPLEFVQDLPLNAGFLAGVLFEPEGLTFANVGTLMIESSADVPIFSLGFSASAEGENFYFTPVGLSADGTSRVLIPHFSTTGVVTLADYDACVASAERLTVGSKERAAQDLACAELAKRLQVPDALNELLTKLAALFDQAQAEISAVQDIRALLQAFGTFSTWLAHSLAIGETPDLPLGDLAVIGDLADELVLELAGAMTRVHPGVELQCRKAKECGPLVELSSQLLQIQHWVESYGAIQEFQEFSRPVKESCADPFGFDVDPSTFYLMAQDETATFSATAARSELLIDFPDRNGVLRKVEWSVDMGRGDLIYQDDFNVLMRISQAIERRTLATVTATANLCRSDDWLKVTDRDVIWLLPDCESDTCSIEIQGAPKEIRAGESFIVAAETTNFFVQPSRVVEEPKISWSVVSGADSVALVPEDPSLRARVQTNMPGEAVIEARLTLVPAVPAARVNLTVCEEASVEIDPLSPFGNSMGLGTSAQLRASVRNDLDEELDVAVMWETSAPNVATIDPTTGLLTAVSTGQVTVIASATHCENTFIGELVVEVEQCGPNFTPGRPGPTCELALSGPSEVSLTNAIFVEATASNRFTNEVLTDAEIEWGTEPFDGKEDYVGIVNLEEVAPNRIRLGGIRVGSLIVGARARVGDERPFGASHPLAVVGRFTGSIDLTGSLVIAAGTTQGCSYDVTYSCFGEVIFDAVGGIIIPDCAVVYDYVSGGSDPETCRSQPAYPTTLALDLTLSGSSLSGAFLDDDPSGLRFGSWRFDGRYTQNAVTGAFSYTFADIFGFGGVEGPVFLSLDR